MARNRGRSSAAPMLRDLRRRRSVHWRSGTGRGRGRMRRTDGGAPMDGSSARPYRPAAPAGRKPWYRVLYIQVLIAILLGVVLGWAWPQLATNEWIKALGDGF